MSQVNTLFVAALQCNKVWPTINETGYMIVWYTKTTREIQIREARAHEFHHRATDEQDIFFKIRVECGFVT